MKNNNPFTTPLFRHLYGKDFSDLQRYIKKKNNLLVKTFRFFDYHFIGFTGLLDNFLQYDREIGKYGLQKASLNFLERSNLGYKVVGSTLPFIQGNNPTIVFGINHELKFEPFILASLIKDPETYIIGAKFLQRFGDNFTKHILPVQQKRFHIHDQKNIFTELRTIFTHPTSVPYIAEGLTETQAQELNKTTFRKTLPILKNNGSIILFPGGGHSRKVKWKKGVGQLLLNIPDEIKQSVDIIPVEITGAKKREIFKHLISTSRNTPPYRELKVKIGEPESLQGILEEIKEENSIKFTTILQSKILSKFS